MRRLLGATAEAALIASLVFGLIAVPALAARGGRGAASPSMTVNPARATAYGAEYIVTGTGFKPSTAVSIVISMPSCCAFFPVTADEAGAFWFSYQTGDPGTYRIDAHQRLNARKLTWMGTTTFEVVAP